MYWVTLSPATYTWMHETMSCTMTTTHKVQATTETVFLNLGNHFLSSSGTRHLASEGFRNSF